MSYVFTKKRCYESYRLFYYFREAFDKAPELTNLLLDDFFRDAVHDCQSAWRDVISKSVEIGIPTPAFSTALAFYDGYRSAKLPANLIQVNLIDVTQSKFSYHISPTIIGFVTRTLNTFWMGAEQDVRTFYLSLRSANHAQFEERRKNPNVSK